MFHDVLHLQSLSSCIGSNSCGVGTASDTDGMFFGATNISSANVGEGFLADSVNDASYSMNSGTDQGMFNDYASINTYWADTTDMDNLRGADITDHSIAGSTETIGSTPLARATLCTLTPATPSPPTSSTRRSGRGKIQQCDWRHEISKLFMTSIKLLIKLRCRSCFSFRASRGLHQQVRQRPLLSINTFSPATSTRAPKHT